jgi:hypothetical protein
MTDFVSRITASVITSKLYDMYSVFMDSACPPVRLSVKRDDHNHREDMHIQYLELLLT